MSGKNGMVSGRLRLRPPCPSRNKYLSGNLIRIDYFSGGAAVLTMQPFQTDSRGKASSARPDVLPRLARSTSVFDPGGRPQTSAAPESIAR